MALQAHGEATLCPDHCRLRAVAAENSERQVAAASQQGKRIPYSLREASVEADPVDVALHALGMDILDEPIPDRLRKLLEEP